MPFDEIPFCELLVYWSVSRFVESFRVVGNPFGFAVGQVIPKGVTGEENVFVKAIRTGYGRHRDEIEKGQDYGQRNAAEGNEVIVSVDEVEDLAGQLQEIRVGILE